MDKKERDMKIDKFWNWFLERQELFAEADVKSILDEIDAELKQIDEGLVVEICREDNGITELQFTANGATELFPLIEEIYQRAPDLDRWKWQALRPPRGFNFEFQTDNLTIDVSQLQFMPLKNEVVDDAIGVRIIQTISPKFQFPEGALDIILGTGVGEAALSLIEYVDVKYGKSKLKGAHPISELYRFIEWKCEKLNQWENETKDN
jgi:hypothetical protein